MRTLFIFVILFFTTSVFANTETAIKNAVEKVAGQFLEVTEIQNTYFEGPLLKKNPVIYVLKLNRDYSIGITAPFEGSDNVEVRLISTTSAVGPATLKMVDHFSTALWDFISIHQKEIGSWSGEITDNQYTHSLRFTVKNNQERLVTDLLQYLIKTL